jgi:hypothetical protein
MYIHDGAGTCSSCHDDKQALGKGFASTHVITTAECNVCHKTTTTWLGASNHSGSIAGICKTCHVLTTELAKYGFAVASHDTSGASCDQCHNSTTWLNATGGMPSNHIPYNAGVTCAQCHTTGYTAKVTSSILHTFSLSYTCGVCHISPNNFTGNNQNTKKAHSGATSSSASSVCTGCHKTAGSYSNWGN